MSERQQRYEVKQREEGGLVPRSIRVDSETRQLLAEATAKAGSQNEALKQALRLWLAEQKKANPQAIGS